MDNDEKSRILAEAKTWFRESVVEKHIKNTQKLANPAEFNINPFTANYLANFLTGNAEPESIAKALIYPRVLGTSISTTFGNAVQKFTGSVLPAFGSAIPGIDIEFTDQIDGRHKYYQLKSGPDTINYDDIETINNHFKSLKAIARTNNLEVGMNDIAVGVIYGTSDRLSSFYKGLERGHNIPVIVGQDFWHRLTGDRDFYFDLIHAVGDVAIEANFAQELEDIIARLANSEEIANISENNHE